MFKTDFTIEEIKDGIRIKDLKKFYASLNANCVTVGVHEDKPEMVKKEALWNEFGTKHIAGKTYRFKKNGEWYCIKKGTDISIPARPFIRMFLYLYSDKYADKFQFQIENALTQSIVKNMLKNPDGEATKIYNVIGESAKILMRQKITFGGFDRGQNNTATQKNQEYNADMTIMMKGFNHPLIEDGTLLGSIDYKVERNK